MFFRSKSMSVSMVAFVSILLINSSCGTGNNSNESTESTAEGGQVNNDIEKDHDVTNEPLKDVSDPRLNSISLPEGFNIRVYAKDVENARSMALGANGTVFVGTRRNDKVYALLDTDGDNVADQRHVISDKLSTPNGVAFRNGDLYVGEIDRILRYDDIENRLTNPPEPQVITEDYPSDKHHGWKYLGFGPDGKLYVPVGAPCNICDEDDPIYSTITRINPDGTGKEIFAEGIRNTVGFDWHPETGELWFTENGADRMGDTLPADELNHAPRKGLHFGFPFCHEGQILDPDHGEGRSCDEFKGPELKLAAHTAALGMKFYTGDMFPAEYKNQIFIAEHGSWNRTDPIGYRVTMARMENGEATGYEVFAEGWLGDDGEAWGRPVDVLQMPDGSILVSDDHASMIYRISYGR